MAPLSARIEAPDDTASHLDEQGRYRLRLHFDQGEAPVAEASQPVRMMQPYGGRGHGLHFLLHGGTDVLIGCVSGDVNQPVVMGALHNAEQASPVTDANKTQHVLRTRGESELLIEDKPGEGRIELFTRERENRLCLDAREDDHRVTLESVKGDFVLEAGRNLGEEIGRSRHLEVGDSEERSVNDAFRLATRKGSIVTSASEDLESRADQELRLQSEQGDIQPDAGGDLLLQSAASCALQVDRGDTSIQVADGGFYCSVAGDCLLEGNGSGVLQMKQQGGALQIDPSGNVVIEGPRVRITGGEITVDGKAISGN